MLNLNSLYSKHATIIPRFSSFISTITSYVAFLTYKWSELKWSENITQSYQILCNPMNRSPPGSSVHGLLQARILEWVAMSSSRASSQPRDRTQVSCIAGGFFTIWPTREAHTVLSLTFKKSMQVIFQIYPEQK